MAKGNTDSYVQKQGEIYHYRRRVPADIQAFVGCKTWKQTLRTAAKLEAHERARTVAAGHDALIKAIRQKPVAERLALAERELEAIDDERVPNQPFDTATRKRFERAIDVRSKLYRAMIAAAEQRLDTLPPEERDAVNEMGGVETFFNQVRRDAFEAETRPLVVRIAEVNGKVRARDAEAGYAAFRTKAVHAAKDQQTLERLGLISKDDIIEEADNPRITTALGKMLADRKQGRSTVRGYNLAVRRFVAIHGNVPVRAITKVMVRAYIKRIETLGDHRRLAPNKRGGLQEPGTNIERIAAPTVGRHLIAIKALLKYCAEQDWVTSNVATGLKPPKDTRPKASKRRPFTREERNQLLAYVISLDKDGANGDMPWLIRLAAYTGCRAEELAQLGRKNVRQEDSVWIVEVDDLDDRAVKNDESVKKIPLHPAICDDFVAWVGKSSGPRVFQSFKTDRDGRCSSKVSGAFGRLMDGAGLPDRRLVLHSFRHTLKREMSNAGLDPDVRREILGHAPKDAHDGYAGHSLSALAAEFARMPPLFD